MKDDGMKMEGNVLISRRRKELFIWFVSLILAGLLVFCCILDLCKERLPGTDRDYSIVILGDSQIGNVSDGKGIAGYLAEMKGVSVLRGGFGGTRASYNPQETYPYSVGNYLSLVKLAEAIAQGDFSVQRAQIAYGEHYRYILPEILDYFLPTIQDLAEVNYGKVDYLIIEHGTNDYNTGRRLDNPLDPYDIETYGGALRYSIELLQKSYPDITYIFMSPTWCYILDQEHGERMSCEDTDFGGGVLEEYVNLEKEIAREYGVYFLDNYHDSEINAATQDLYFVDGLHLNSEGQKVIARRLADLIGRIEEAV